MTVALTQSSRRSRSAVPAAVPAYVDKAVPASPESSTTRTAACSPRPVPTSWPAATRPRAELLELVASAPSTRRRGLDLLLDWLEEQPGTSWQERWLESGADSAGERWAELPASWLSQQGRYSGSRLGLLTSSLATLIAADAVRPSLSWLLTAGKKRKLGRELIRISDPEGFARLDQRCEQDKAISADVKSDVVYRCAVIIAAKGGRLADINAGDVMEVIETELALRGRASSAAATFELLRELGNVAEAVPSLRQLRRAERASVEQLVDRYDLSCRAIRDLIVEYLKERQPVVDYTTLNNGAYVLARCFWKDIEAHHPGIDTLALQPGVASAWKQRLRTRTRHARSASGERVEVRVERLSYLDVLASVRAFYLDLAEWALEEPERWGALAAPCPIRAAELSRRKEVRRRKARMDARTRARLPALPRLVAATDSWRSEALALLEAGRLAAPGERFGAGQALVRLARPRADPSHVWAEDPTRSRCLLLDREEERAFWAWAVIEVLRLTGIRAEELLELSHHALVQYRLPTSGELVPLLQIAPSKTDAERLMVVSPELADVLSAIICRVRDGKGAVPLVSAWDHHERVWLAPSPLLFQHRVGVEPRAFSVGLVASLLDEALSRAALTDESDGSPLRCTAHDFRRMFITEAVMNGLPPHIAQVIAGHEDLNVTMAYKAVYPEEAIQAYLAFLARRRALRPSEEYRTPTEEEWEQFLGSFERRKVSLGTCARAFGTPCIHEHACVRCPMLWPDPAQRSRLLEICDNLTARIEEAEREGWLGEVEGLEVSLAGAKDKLAQIERRGQASTPIELAARQEPAPTARRQARRR